MKILTGGHRYELENFENKEADGQILQFIEKLPADEFAKTGLPFPEPMPPEGYSPGQLFTVRDGTTNEEVLKVLINRMKFLDAKFPSVDNVRSVEKLEEALFWMNHRTLERLARQVEGKALA